MTFTFEIAEQDGYEFRAVDVWPSGEVPVRAQEEPGDTSSAMRSELRLTYDDGAPARSDRRG